jgi:hypothetical protein
LTAGGGGSYNPPLFVLKSLHHKTFRLSLDTLVAKIWRLSNVGPAALIAVEVAE